MGGKGRKYRGAASISSNLHSVTNASNAKVHHSSRHEKPFRHPQHSQYPQHIVHSKKYLPNSRLPIQLKQPLKLSSHSGKRARMSAASNNPTTAKIHLSGPTGLESVIQGSGELGMTELSTNFPAFAFKYQIRDKYAERDRRRTSEIRSGRVIRQQRLLSNSTRHNSKLIISKQKGMRNFTGALCYRHSLFQALLHVPMFTNWLMSHSQLEDCVESDQENCVSCVLKAVFMAYRTGSGAELDSALHLANAVFKRRHWKTDTGSGHGDPQEQLSFITDLMETQVPNATYQVFQASRCLLIDSVIKCNACSYESGTRANVMGFLHVGLRPRAQDGKLSSYIANNMSEKVEGYKCEKCKDDGNKRRSHQIAHSPDVLIVQLVLFNPINGKKDSVQVDCENALDLNRYRSPLNKHNSTYQLIAVVMHCGGSSFGHYTCTARGDDGQWYLFNDDHVSKISAERATKPEKDFTPYLLFYQRVKG